MSDEERLPGEFGQFYERNFAFVHTLVRNMRLLDPEDMCQDVFLVAHQKYGGFDAKRSAKAERAWLRRIVINLARNKWRKAQRTRAVMAEAERLPNIGHGQYASVGPEQQALARPLLDGFLDALDDTSRIEFILSHVEGMSSREIARRFHVSHNAVQWRLREANRAFSQHFEHDNPRVRLIAAAQANTKQARVKVRSALLLSPGLLGRAEVDVAGASSWITRFVGHVSTNAATTVAVTAAVVATTVVIASTEPRRDVESSATPARTSVPEPKRAAESETSLAQGPAIEVSLPPSAIDPRPPRQPPPKPAVTPSPTAPIDRKESLREARELIQRGQPNDALDLLRSQPPPESPNLGFQWRATEVYALCESGREREAKGRIRVWDTEHPGDFTPEQIANPCSSPP